MSPSLSAKARRALDAICDTFVPGGDGLPSATERGRSGGAAGARGAQPARRRAQAGRAAARPVGHAPAVRDRRRRGAAASPRSRRRSASRCCSPGPTAACRSGGPPSRRCARARCSPTTARAATTALATRPGTRSATPVRSARRRIRRPRTIEPTEVAGDITLDCDVVVVGSGAGGGTAAAVLAQARARRGDRRGRPLLHASGTSTAPSCPASTASTSTAAAWRAPTAASACWPRQGLGGTTLVNYTFSFRDTRRRPARVGRRARHAGRASARTSTAASTPSGSASA